MKIRSNVHVSFSYTLPDEAELTNDTSANKKNLIFFWDQCKLLQYLKFHPLFVVDTSKIIHHEETFGLITYILTYLVLAKSNV